VVRHENSLHQLDGRAVRLAGHATGKTVIPFWFVLE
jgi:hypothetical protein